ncbi:hypothetical protein PMPD1_2493 [Paramixta manurensis]|uniref:Uncharacterized protein n=1 Tax=Paramixta manurensis TaxID=2740817 RepID=A0A6M8U9R7_9GAMM|nr:hypothetical protein PMPD1_2493 [Erwiniaceae bacterium PD-1]
MTIVNRPDPESAGAKIDDMRQELLSRKKVGKAGLPFHMLREDQIKTRWTEPEAVAIKAASEVLSSNPAVETNIAAIRGFLAMFAESPEMLQHVHNELQSAGLPVPDWLPVPQRKQV